MKKFTLIILTSFSIISSFNAQNFLGIKDRPQLKKPPVFKKADLKSSYSNKPRLELEMVYNLAENNWIYTDKYEYEYYDIDYLKRSIYYNRYSEADDWTIDYMYEYEYDSNGNITIETNTWESYENRYINTYNEDDYLSEQVKQYYSNGWVNNWREVYAFDASGNPVSVTHYYWDNEAGEWSYYYLTSFTLDNENRIIEELTLDYDTNGDGIVNDDDSPKKTVYTYDNGRLILEDNYYGTDTETWEIYDRLEWIFEDNKLISYNGYHNDWETGELELYWTELWEYDEYGNPTSFVMSDLEDDEWYNVKATYEYDYSQSMADYVIPPIDLEIEFVNKVIGYDTYVMVDESYTKTGYAEVYYTGEVPTLVDENTAEETRIVVYSKAIQFTWFNSGESRNLSLYDISGNQLKNMVIQNREMVSTTDIKPGIYIYHLKSETGVPDVGKVVIK